MSACVEQFSSYINVLENALNMIDDNESSETLRRHDGIVEVLDTIMEVNMMLVYRFQCGPVSKNDMADVREKVTSLLEKTKGKAPDMPRISCEYVVS